MKRLTPEHRDRAVAFVLAKARPLDRALCHHHVLGGDRRGVLDELAALQNADGGFRGMEADFDDGGASSVVNTLRALDVLEDLEVLANHPLARRAVASLVAAYVPAWRSWRLVPRHDNSRPHAPWWRWTDGFDEGWGFFADNPRPHAAASLYAFAGAVEAAFLRGLAEAVVSRAVELDPAVVQKDAAECYGRFACSAAVPAEVRAPVLARLTEVVEATLTTDPAQWGGYGLQPLDIVDSPDSPLYAACREHVDRHLDYVIDTQGEDGAWSPHWSWMGAFPEAWEGAKVAWQGRLTVLRLRQLAAFGRAS